MSGLASNDTDLSAVVASEWVPCPICEAVESKLAFSARDFHCLLPGQFFVSQCFNCDVFFQNPRPRYDDILRYYPHSYDCHKESRSRLIGYLRQMLVLRPLVRQISKLVPHGGAILEVGCGNGDLLSALQGNRWNLQGIDAAPRAVKVAREKGLDVVEGVLETSDIESESKDIVLMNHVLEHVESSRRTLKHVEKILKQGGYLIGEVPTIEPLTIHLFKKYYFFWDLPRHLVLFQEEHLRRSLQECGFKVVQMKRLPAPSIWIGSLANYFNDITRWSRPIHPVLRHSLLLVAAFTLISYGLLFWSSPIISFVARKPVK